jgi:hypothetical protein
VRYEERDRDHVGGAENRRKQNRFSIVDSRIVKWLLDVEPCRPHST